jgi:carboxylate-amine ligase
MDLNFNTSKNSTIGIELEMRILDKDTLDVKNYSEIIFESIDESLKPYIHKELLKSMFEIVTPVCKDVNEAVGFIDSVLQKVAKIGEKNDFYIAAMATHPYEKKEDSQIYNDPRYEEFKKEFGIVIRNFLISGLHIHVGIDDKEDAIKAYNGVINYLPLFLALSANSPFFDGEDTGLKSYRTKIFDKLPRAGVPEYFDSYDEYSDVYEQLHKTGAIKKAKDVWWDVRLSPNFGTIELRVCDAFYDKDRLRLLAMLFQGVVEYSKKHHPKKEFHQINLQNKWNATRHGLKGDFIKQNKVFKVREKIYKLIEKIEKAGIFEKLGTHKDIDELKSIVEKPSLATGLRKVYEKNNDFKEVIKSQIIK